MPYGFTYVEHHGDGINGYTKKVSAAITYDTAEWEFTVYMDGREVAKETGRTWEKFVWNIANYLALPQVSSDSEYQELLKEWVDSKGNKIVLNKTSTIAPATKSNKEKFEELVKYIEKYQVPYITKTEIIRLNDISLQYKLYHKSPGIKEYTITLDLHHSRFLNDWQFTVYKNENYLDDATGKGWEELLKALRDSEFGVYAIIPKPGSKEYESLAESASIAAEFKEYENLWD